MGADRSATESSDLAVRALERRDIFSVWDAGASRMRLFGTRSFR